MAPKGLLIPLLAFASLLNSPGASAANIQKAGLTVPTAYADDLQAVKDIFNVSYSAYRKYAWGHDDLTPLSMSYTDPRNGWGASIVDAMSTMYIMGFEDWFQEALNFTQNINFNSSQTGDNVSLFETTIRYVGGFISAYELSGNKYPSLLTKAQEIADYLVHGFDGSVGVPYGFISLKNGTAKAVQATSNIAEAGTLTLEWDRLSLYTQNDTYRNLAVQSAAHIAGLNAPLPGLAGQGISPSTGQFSSAYVTWGGGSDSYFEYLIKYSRLTNAADNFTATWELAVDSSIRYLLSKSTVGDWTYLADYTDAKRIRHISSHLACFHGGNWIMGGRMLNNDTIVEIGLNLTDACWNTYASTQKGIGPEVFAWMASGLDGSYTGATPSAADTAFYNEHGFYIYPGYTYYDLRPEVLESNFYAWRATGDTKYLDRARSAYQSFNKYVKSAGVGYDAIGNVNNVADTSEFDNMESFWFAEVLKYLYLTFDDPSHISLDEWVFNTEAHPFKAPTAKETYAPPVRPTPTQQGPLSGLIAVVAPVVSPIPNLLPGLKQLSALFLSL